MGLLGTLLKVAGKVVKVGASVATRGASDKLLTALKGNGRRIPPAEERYYPTLSEEALAAKVTEPTAPNVRLTQRLFADASAGAGSPGYYAKAAPKPRKARRKAKRAPARVVMAQPRARPRAAARAAARRQPPKGGLDLRAISQAWAAQGRPGTWQDFIRANPIRKA